MAIITLDFETYYSKDYSLRKMSTAEYILDPRFQVIMCTIKIGANPTNVYYGHDNVARAFAAIDWSKHAVLAHHTHFDGAILGWKFGHYPKMYLCTLSEARAITHAKLGRSSLEKVSDYLGLPPKGKEVHSAIGKRFEDFTAAELLSYGAYCLRDTDNCYGIFQKFRPAMPASELDLIDSIIRMYVQPQVFLDAGVLNQYMQELAVEKANVMARVASIPKDIFSSNQKFAALLREHGIEPPTKISPATGEPTFALAKNDRAFKEMCEDDRLPLEVQCILAARLATKSTIEETRAAKMHRNALREWPDGSLGWAPVPLKYWGAHTGRLSGDGGENWQNFKRGSRIREAVKAPPGMRVLHRDASQIEARMVAWLARCMVLIEAFAEGRDVYSEFASIVFGRTITKADKVFRFIGKTGILGLGYQCGWEKFRHMLFIGSAGQNYRATEEEAKNIVYKYRRRYEEIPRLWEAGEVLLDEMVCLSTPVVRGTRRRHLVGQVHQFPVVEVGFDSLWLPNGMAVQYPNIRREAERNAQGQIRHTTVCDDAYGATKHLYGGIITENMSQALSRIIITDIASRVKRDTGYAPFLTTHDSLDYCVPEGMARDFDKRMEHEFSIRPSWAPDLPLASEGGFGWNLAIAESEHHPEHNH